MDKELDRRCLPQATQILDWFHVMEHLGEFEKEYFGEGEQKEDWINQQKNLLWESRAEQAIQI